MRKFENLLVTGGAGFIGVNFIRFVLEKTDFKGRIINLDKLTYAGNPRSLADLETKYPHRYMLEKADICDFEPIHEILVKYKIDGIVHFAAESHVDRSIHGPSEFVKTNVMGTFNILEVLRDLRKTGKTVHLHHVSTDEVFGSLGDTGFFTEKTAYDPRSPYSASKAASDHFVSAYHHTYGQPITMSNCSNNYGPYHFPEKLIPLMISNCLEGKNLPVYGDGMNVRDWLFVEDHARAIWEILTKGVNGESYNVGGESERTNLQVVHGLCEAVALAKGFPKDHYKKLITFVADRPGHDRRYAIDCSKLKKELGWKPLVNFEEGLKVTVAWYLNNNEWLNTVKTGEYKNWIQKNYN